MQNIIQIDYSEYVSTVTIIPGHKFMSQPGGIITTLIMIMIIIILIILLLIIIIARSY